MLVCAALVGSLKRCVTLPPLLDGGIVSSLSPIGGGETEIVVGFGIAGLSPEGFDGMVGAVGDTMFAFALDAVLDVLAGGAAVMSGLGGTGCAEEGTGLDGAALAGWTGVPVEAGAAGLELGWVDGLLVSALAAGAGGTTGAAGGLVSGVAGLASPRGLGGSTCRIVSAGFSDLVFGSAD